MGSANNVPQDTIHDILTGYRSGALAPEAVFKTAVSRASEALRDESSAKNEWINVVSQAAVEKQLTELHRNHPDPQKAPLYGIPFAVKDNIDVAGIPTTAACDAFAYTPAKNAICISRLMAAGALFVGKTNLDQFATGLVGTRSPYGAVPSAISEDHISGGSSSGSATVVSRGVVPFSLGTDTAGSGRVPAAFNNIFGLKSSVGRISTQGVVPACRSLDCVSVFALTASDASRVLSVLESDTERGDVRFASPSPGPSKFRSSFRVGVPTQLVEHMDSTFRSAFEKEVSLLSAEVVDVDFTPLHKIANMLYGGAWVAERYGAVRKILLEKPASVDPTVRAVVAPGADILASDAFEDMHELESLRAEADSIWQRVDVLLCPAVPSHPKFALVAKEPLKVNSQLGSYTNFVNLLSWCCVVTPCEPLGFGLSWIAPAGYDVALLTLATELNMKPPGIGLHVSEEAKRMPQTLPAVEATMRLAVVGAHLVGMPLHHELVSVRAIFVAATTTAPSYRLYAIAGTVPRKPALVRSKHGRAIQIEVYDVPITTVGDFLNGIPHPLGLGRIETADGEWITGFIAEPCAKDGATDVTKYGGWRAYIDQQTPKRQGSNRIAVAVASVVGALRLGMFVRRVGRVEQAS